MKKIMAVVLSLAMMIGMAAICSFAAEDGYTVNGVVSIPENGKTTLSTSVTVPENANLAGIQFDISYNADKLTFDSVDTAVADNVIAGWTKDTADKGAGKYRIQAFTAAPTEKSILNNATAKIADVVFTVAEGAVIENDDISIKVVDAASDQGDEVITVTDRFQGKVEVLKVDTAALEKAIADAEAARLMAAMEQEQLMEEKQQEELSREDVLRLNKIHTRYQQAEIEDFIEAYMHDDHMEVKDIDIRDEESFEKLILAYDYSTRRNSKYKVIERDDKLIDNGSYRYPALTFVRRKPKS